MGQFVKCFSAHKPCLYVRKSPFVQMGELTEQVFAHNGIKNLVSQKFQSLIVTIALLFPFVVERTVGKCLKIE